MKKFFLVFVFVILQAPNIFAQVQFEPPVIIEPPNPMVGDVIRIGLFTTFYPSCLILPEQNQQGDTHLFEFDNNHIDFTVVALTIPICNPFPVTPAPREFYELGQLQEGTYTMQVYGVDNVTPRPAPITDPPAFFPYTYGGLMTFSVVQAKPIDSLSKLGLFLLIFFILTLTLFLSKRTGVINYRR